MVARDLLRELEGRGVRLAVEGGRLVARAPQGAVTPELAERIKAQKDALLRELQAGTGGQLALLPKLPAPLERLVSAAASGQVHGGAALPSGLVPDLGGYVLAWAAAYLTGDHRHALARLEEARGAWWA